MTYLGRLVARAGGPMPGALRPRHASRFELPAPLTGAVRPPLEPAADDGAPAFQTVPTGPAFRAVSTGPATPGPASATPPATALATPSKPAPRVSAARHPADVAPDDRGPAGTATGVPTAAAGRLGTRPATTASPASPTDPVVPASGPAPLRPTEAGSATGPAAPLGPPRTLDQDTVLAPRPGSGPTASPPPRPGADRATERAPAAVRELAVFADAREPIDRPGHEHASPPSTDGADGAYGAGRAPSARSARPRPGATPASAAPTLIEVTIGRIEVRSAAERRERPAPLRRPSPPLALDDYLGQRRGS